MQHYPLLLYPNPILHKKALAGEGFTQEVHNLISHMQDVMKTHNGVGLAAPQVGISLRLILVQNGETVEACMNPQVLSSSKEREVDTEGCLSIPGLWIPISRPARISVSYLAKDGKEVTRDLKGFLARVFQHEIDHINGKLIIDHLGFWERFKLRKRLKNLGEKSL
ncbi:MAG: peptide deformylase [bacterium]|nr:peptide deformylase [bacterium]